MTPRLAHKKVARLVLPLLALSALTGLVYRVGRVWFGMTDETGIAVRAVHDGTWVGAWFSPLYVLVVGLGLLFLIASGLAAFVRRPKSVTGPRQWHRLAGLGLMIPLAASAVTGIGFRVTQAWFGWTKEQAQWLLDIHQGTLLFGRDYRAYYVIVIGLGLLGLVLTGATMLGWIGGGGRKVATE
ncbi:MAG: PepSY domain-containing protein [Acidobacteria bacterium]|nr:PepSY domain-containing protein [Acidobacteriota bacterium]